MQQQISPSTGKPLQRVTWNEKIKNKKEWFKKTADYYMSLANFNFGGEGNSRKDIGQLYRVYNGEFPAKWFEHITNPLNAADPLHKNFPAKIRPVPMLRTNIDLLAGEYPRRPFVYQVTNLGEDGYSTYNEKLKSNIVNNLTQHFVAEVQQQAIAQGIPMEEIPGLDEIELPGALKERFSSSYKDAQAIKGQRWMERAIKSKRVKEEMQRMFKDWLITGYTRSYKSIEKGELVYERVSPMNIDSDKSTDEEFIENGEWAVCRRLLTASDLVDHFYEELTEADHLEIENRTHFSSPANMFAKLNSYSEKDTNKIPLFHIVWKGRKPVKILTYPDPLSGQMQQMEVDEDYPVNKEMGESSETIWKTEIYETYRVGDNIYLRMRALPIQPEGKLPYNGMNFSDVHATNISVLELGLPTQIMYMIVTRTLEMTIAKSKGKIFLIDKNAIPRGNGWNDEKFFYYSEALGYALLNRNQQGVDKSFNQYSVVDMGLFDHITKLIELQAHFKQEWDDILGINRPRKGQTYASDGKATSEMGLMQSSVITDSIFNRFEQFTETDLQGILECSKYTELNDILNLSNLDDFDRGLLESETAEYSYAQLGLILNSSIEEYQTLQMMKQQATNFAQGGANASTVLEMLHSNNVAELKMKLKKIEEMQAEMEQNAAESEHEAQAAADERAKVFAEFENSLEATLIDKTWDRKDQNEMIKGEYVIDSFGGDGDNNDNGIPDGVEIEKRIIERQDILTKAQIAREQMAHDERQHTRDDNTRNREIASKEKIAKDKKEVDLKKVSAARAKAKATKKKT